MKLNRRPIGEYVRPIDVRNRGLTVQTLRGVSINKRFMPSVANIIGTDLSNYKVVYKNQFVFNPMHVGRDEVLPIEMLTTEDPIIVSPAFTVFEIIDQSTLLPEYLMIWCRRREFDRRAWFATDASVRGGLNWCDFCRIELPVPSINVQLRIVNQYKTIVDRIELIERLNQKLEEAAETLFKRWFVDFEFPISPEYARQIGKPDLEGKPYKSSGGEMSRNEALATEIPTGWRDGRFSDLGRVVGGATPSTSVPEYWTDNGIVWISPSDLSLPGYKFISRGHASLTQKGFDSCSTVMLPINSVLFSSRAPIGLIAINKVPVCTNQGFKSIIPKKEFGTPFVYYYLKFNTFDIRNQVSGSTFDEIPGKLLRDYVSLRPPSSVCQDFQRICEPLFRAQAILESEHEKSCELLKILHSKVSVIL